MSRTATATSPIERIIGRLEQRGFQPHSTGADQWESRCPSHEGTRRNLSIKAASDGTVLLRCHHAEECSAEAIVSALGLTMADLFPAELRNGKGEHRGDGKDKGKGGPKPAYPTAEAALKALRLGTPSVVWTYRHADCIEAMKVARFDGAGGKTYRPVHRDPSGAWRIGDPPGLLPLYHLAVLAGPGPVVVAEGEKCADLVRSLGLLATTSSHGAEAAHKTDWGPLAGRDVAILPDVGPAGEEYSRKVVQLLARLDPPARPKVVRLPDLAEDGDDIEQWLEARAGRPVAELRAELLQLIEAAPLADHAGGGGGRPRAEPSSNGKPAGPNEADDDPHRLARVYLDRVRHPDGLTLQYWREDWHRWDGGAYRIAPDKEVRGEVNRSIKEEFDRLNLEALEDRNGKKAPPTVRPVTTRKVADVLQALTGLALLRAKDCPSTPSWICRNPPWPASEVLPTRNALVHLPSLVDGRPCTVPPTPAFFCPYCLDFDFNPSPPEPVEWLKFLGTLWGDDHQSIGLLQEWFGYKLTSDTSQQKMLMLIGPKRSGKGTIARILRSMVGPENVASPTLSKLSTGFGLASLIGKTAAIIADARLSGRADQAVIVERLLSITGEDSQSIDRKYREDWEGKLSTRFLLISNELPRLSDASAALPSRMLVLRLTRSFYGQEDRGLLAKLTAELPGILLWAVAGWNRLRDRGRFEQPESSREMAEEMEAIASPIGVFLSDCCKVDPAEETPTDTLYGAWKDWCQAKGREHAGDAQNFGRNLRAAVPTLATRPTRRDGRPIRIYVGVGLVNPPERPDDGDAPAGGAARERTGKPAPAWWENDIASFLSAYLSPGPTPFSTVARIVRTAGLLAGAEDKPLFEAATILGVVRVKQDGKTLWSLPAVPPTPAMSEGRGDRLREMQTLGSLYHDETPF